MVPARMLRAPLTESILLAMDKATIDNLFELMATVTPLQRGNVRSLYLDVIGPRIIEHCRSHYRRATKAPVRNDFIRFVIRYGKSSVDARTLAIEALGDKSAKVRSSARAVLAYGCARDALPMLRELLTKETSKAKEEVQRTIEAIETGDPQRFRDPMYTWWSVPQDAEEISTDESIDFYIVKHAPGLVVPLTAILGTIYPSRLLEN